MKPTITICGLGPGGEGDLTEAVAAALASSEHIYLRTERHPTASRVQGAITFDAIYDAGDSLAEVYQTIADMLVEAASEHGDVLYVVPGSPLVLERSVRHLRSDDRVEVKLVPSLSFLDVAWARLGIDPVEESVRLIDGHVFEAEIADESGPLLVAHAHATWVLSDIKLALDAGPDQRVIVLKALGTEDEEIFELSWPELDRSFEPDHLTSLYIPEILAPVGQELKRTVELMRRLRQECPWDKKQTHDSLRRYLLEESYEVLEAIDQLNLAPSGPVVDSVAPAGGVSEEGLDQVDEGVASKGSVSNAYVDDGYGELEEELGDLWFQILFHAELASEAGAFTIDDVARTVHEKLVNRHPHVFGDTEAATSDEVVPNWEAIKKVEKGRESIMDGIPVALPALALATKVMEKAARSQNEADPVRVGQIIDAGLGLDVDEEQLGVLLLAVTDRARSLGVDPEHALRQAALAARDRFRSAEIAKEDPGTWVFG